MPADVGILTWAFFLDMTISQACRACALEALLIGQRISIARNKDRKGETGVTLDSHPSERGLICREKMGALSVSVSSKFAYINPSSSTIPFLFITLFSRVPDLLFSALFSLTFTLSIDSTTSPQSSLQSTV